MEYLLDTNICIYIIKKKPILVLERFKEIRVGSVFISSITLTELQYGVEKSSIPDKNRDALEKFLISIEILEFDIFAANEYGKIRNVLEKKGNPIGSLDTLIAAHARSRDLILVTNNEREFQKVIGLKIENWTK